MTVMIDMIQKSIDSIMKARLAALSESVPVAPDSRLGFFAKNILLSGDLPESEEGLRRAMARMGPEDEVDKLLAYAKRVNRDPVLRELSRIEDCLRFLRSLEG